MYLDSREAALRVARYYCDKFNELHPERENLLGHPAVAYVLDFADREQVERERAECRGAGHLLCNDPQRIKIVIRSDGVAAEDRSHLDESFSDVYEVLEQADETSELEEPKKPRYRIHENYDFAHCTNYYEAAGDQLVLRPAAMQALLARQLVYQGSKYPICSMIRTRKFLQRGWHINAGQYLKMAFQVSELDLRDLAVLEDQLVGVDSAYFLQLIAALQERQSADPDFQLTAPYLATIVDRLF